MLDIGRLLLELMSVGYLHRDHEAVRTLPVDKATIAEYIIADCPEELEALIYWCCEEHPLRRPTLSQCSMMVEDIYEKYCAILMHPTPATVDDTQLPEESKEDQIESTSPVEHNNSSSFNPFEDIDHSQESIVASVAESNNHEQAEEDGEADKVSKMIKTFEK